MNCNYPMCRNKAEFVPVIALPTVRTVGETTTMVKTSKPTYLLLKEVCTTHRNHYILTDWINRGDWRYIQEAAKANGFKVEEPEIMPITFKPIGWEPDKDYLELERS